MKPKEEITSDQSSPSGVGELNNNTTATIITMNHTDIGDCDDLSDDGDSNDSQFDDTDLIASACQDEITAQLAAAGPIGVAAAAAIATAKKRKRPHSFETNPSIRKRQQTRLSRKLKATIDEYTTRVGQQAVVLIVTPGKPQNNFKVFGARPLENVVRNCRNIIMQDLETALAQQAPPQVKEDPSRHELPPLVVDGIPTPVEKMTQAQLRAFIPLMLKYSTGRGKPGWGKESTRPVWWPKDLPWANVRSDARSEEEKQKVSWTHALRQIVINCYKYHCREDLLPQFNEDDDKNSKETTPKEKMQYQQVTYTPTMVQAINNPDGTVSLIQMDPNSSALVTLPDGTQAQVRAVSAIQGSGTEATQAVQALADLSTTQDGDRVTQIAPVNVDLSGDGSGQHIATIAEATIGPDGQIILTGEDGTQSTFPVSGMVTIPVSMYQTVVTNIGNLSEGIPVTMSTTIGSESASSTTIPVEDQVNDASTTTANEMEDVKNVLNGTRVSVVTSEEES
ncbi:DNA-binding protein P3A2-like isoform X3 [Brevipalpus obovatus]|uniref:DNA-binding protein P3A2-like isoform X3 n=1 Tax=Brevipalpus obovatus TaxID=246614 RepID=UPI003D9F809A